MTDHEINQQVKIKCKESASWIPDYCNEPSMGYWIIRNNNISLIAPDGEHGKWDAIYGDVLIQDTNPLRAAMIAYITGDGTI